MTRWNPSGLSNNCGFCAISYALEMQNGTLLSADDLYERTLERLHIERKGNEDPVPRMLVFPEVGLDGMRVSVQYAELEGRGRGLSDYTIWSVAENAGLRLESGDKDMLRALMEFAERSQARWTLDDFVRARAERPGLAVRPPMAAVKKHVEDSLKGNSIIGSKSRGYSGTGHFMNMSFSPQGEWKLFDPQIGTPFDGKNLKRVLGQIDLFERVRSAPRN